MQRSSGTVTAGQGELVSQAIHYLERHRHEPLQVCDVARHVALSPKYLSHLFKRATGRSPIAYLTMLRMERARQLLTLHERSIAEIAFAVGYHDVHYFTRVFVRHVGMPPGEYRHRCRMPLRTSSVAVAMEAES